MIQRPSTTTLPHPWPAGERPLPTTWAATSTTSIAIGYTIWPTVTGYTLCTNTVDFTWADIADFSRASAADFPQVVERRRATNTERIAQSNEELTRARQRAKETLLALLDPANRELLQQREYIQVTGSAGGEYRVSTDHYEGNVTLQSADGDIRLCAHPRMHDEQGRRIPLYDVVLVQLLMLTTDEPRFLDIANVYE